jgi:predicted GNAT family N-acyltransferase
MNLFVTEHLSEFYWQAVQLRREVLRYPLGLDYSEEQLLSETNATHFIGECSGEIFAYAMATAYSASVVQIRQVAVRSDLQGRGIGSQIMEFTENWAVEQGFSEALLHARGYAIPFYERIGYIAHGDEYFEVGIPHRTMTKMIKSPSVSK